MLNDMAAQTKQGKDTTFMLQWAFHSHAQTAPDRVALVCDDGRQVTLCTYGELRDRARELRQALDEVGLLFSMRTICFSILRIDLQSDNYRGVLSRPGCTIDHVPKHQA